MAVTPHPARGRARHPHTPPPLTLPWRFARLKVRILGNAMRGRPSRVLLFLGGVAGGLYLAAVGFGLLALSTEGDAQVRLMVASYGGAALVVGSVLLPLVWFGVDDTLDPARFALLPLTRGQLVGGLFTAALLGVPAVGLLLASAGLLVPAAVHGGAGAAAGQAAGLVGGLLLCVAAGRAVTSAFATLLRSRRARDLAGILLAAVAALVAPLQFVVVGAAGQADWDGLAAVARVVGWTPFGAPYTVGWEVAAGRPVAGLAKLAITAAALAALLWWWSRAIEPALVGAVSAGGARRPRRTGDGPVAQLLPRLPRPVPPTASGAMVARELRYWWRDARRRANLITVVVIGMLVPVVVTAGGGRIRVDLGDGALPAASSPTTIGFTLVFVGAMAAALLANQFGFDGTAYATNLAVGVPGRREMAARATAHGLLIGPLLVLTGVVAAAAVGGTAAGGTAVTAWGVLFAGYGAGLAVCLPLSVLVPYALPESSNPFAAPPSGGFAKSLLALVAIVATYLLAAPVLGVAHLLSGTGWSWLVTPLGAGYGLAAAALGARVGGAVLDRRGPDLLAAVTPSR